MGHDDFREDPIVDFEVWSPDGGPRSVVRDWNPNRAAYTWVEQNWHAMGRPGHRFKVHVLGPEHNGKRPLYTIHATARAKVAVETGWTYGPKWADSNEDVASNG